MVYNIPAGEYSVELKIKKSRFIATCAHITSAAEAKAFHDDIKKRHKTASHNCFAFVAGSAGSEIENGISDDGEPRGTAGHPMLKILKHSGTGEIAVVVTRYYGGIKLGKGGLVRAYSAMVNELLKTMPVIEKKNGIPISLKMAYNEITAVKSVIKAHNGEIITEGYSENISLNVKVPEEELNDFIEHLPHKVIVKKEK